MRISYMGPPCIDELHRNFKKRESINVKTNNFIESDGLPAPTWNTFCANEKVIKRFLESFNSIRQWREFKKNRKLAVVCPSYEGNVKWEISAIRG